MKQIKRSIRNFFIGIKNIWIFRREIMGFRDWDYVHSLRILKKAFEQQLIITEKFDMEGETTPVASLKEMIKNLEIITDDDFYSKAEQELGVKINNGYCFRDGKMVKLELSDEELENNKRVFERAMEIENEAWDNISKGFKNVSTWWY